VKPWASWGEMLQSLEKLKVQLEFRELTPVSKNELSDQPVGIIKNYSQSKVRDTTRQRNINYLCTESCIEQYFKVQYDTDRRCQVHLRMLCLLLSLDLNLNMHLMYIYTTLAIFKNIEKSKMVDI
jgi:hypothetical protein